MMGGNGKHRWKISFYRSSSSNSSPSTSKMDIKPPPMDFVCPVYGTLMADPVIVSSGQTFERATVQVCRDLGFSPKLEDGSRPDFSTVIANRAIKSTIAHWCNDSGMEHPRLPEYESVEKVVRALMAAEEEEKLSRSRKPDLRVSERELLRGVAEHPPVIFSHATTELGHRVNHFYSSSSEESVVIPGTSNPGTPLPLTTRPLCYSSSSSSEIAELDALTGIPNSNGPVSEEEENLLKKLKNPEVVEQAQNETLLLQTKAAPANPTFSIFFAKFWVMHNYTSCERFLSSEQNYGGSPGAPSQIPSPPSNSNHYCLSPPLLSIANPSSNLHR